METCSGVLTCRSRPRLACQQCETASWIAFDAVGDLLWACQGEGGFRYAMHFL